MVDQDQFSHLGILPSIKSRQLESIEIHACCRWPIRIKNSPLDCCLSDDFDQNPKPQIVESSMIQFVYHEDVEVLSFLEVQLNLFSLELMKLLLVTAPQVSPSFDKYQLKNEAFERNVGLLRGGFLPSLEIGNNTHWRPNRHRRQVFVPWNLIIARNMSAHQVVEVLSFEEAQ